MGKYHAKVYKKCSFITGRNRKPRPKTFSTEEAAKQWAEAEGIKEYRLQNLRNLGATDKKIRIVVQ